MEKDEFADIKQLVEMFQQNMKQHLPALKTDIESLINAGSKDSNIIAHTLDTLLSLTQMGVGTALFVQLLEYYKTIDAEGAAFYWNEYDKEEEEEE